MKQFSPTLALCIAIIAVAAGSAKADYPVQLSLWPPKLAIVPEDESVRGLRLSVWGRNHDVSGLDLGIVNQVTGDFRGIEGGIVNMVDGNFRGIQGAFYGYNRVGGEMFGWQRGAVNRVKGDFIGLQEGFLSASYQNMKGVQASLIWNHTGEETAGVQLGFVNTSGSVRGAQIGIVNLTQRMYGLQIGLWNQINENEKLKVLPIVNWRF